MKKKLFTVALMVVMIASILMTIFAITVSAADVITVTYNNHKGEVRKTATQNDDGSFTLLETKLSKDATFTLTDGTVVNKEFYGWFDEEGNFYEPGQRVTFTKSTRIYEAYGITVYNMDDLISALNGDQQSVYVRLGTDITSTKQLSVGWDTGEINLNGYNLTITADNSAINVTRGALIIHGEGTITHTPATTNKDDRGFVSFSAHGFGDESNPQLFWIGKDVKITTPYHLLYDKSIKAGYNMPDMVIAGDITAKSVARIDQVVGNARCYIASTAKINVSTSFLDFRNQSSTDAYMNVTLGGNITLTNSSALILNDFMMTNRFNIFEITNGSFTVSATDAERISMFLPETLMLKPTENSDGTTTYNVVEADCVHSWEKDMEQSVEATPNSAGIDIYACSICGATKQTITVYSPKNTPISVTVKTENGLKTYTVLAGDVLDFMYNGVGAAAICYVGGLKDAAEFTADQIVAFDIPAGVREFFGFANSTVETVNILDGAEIKIYSLTAMTGIKNINVGASTVTFESLKSSTVEKISNIKAGANIKVTNQCFSGGKNIKHFEMIAGSTYVFGTDAFRTSTLEEVIIPDNSTVTLGQKSFAETQTIKYVYVGANAIASKKLGDDDKITSVFGGNGYLEKVVLMDITYIGKWTLSTKKYNTTNDAEKPLRPFTDLVVYAHSEELSFHSEAFNDRAGDYTVYIYTADPDMSSVTGSSNYVIYRGIGHAYTEEIITESTCVTPGTVGYVTDCSCGIDYRENSYSSVANKQTALNGVTYEAFGTGVSELPLATDHTVSDILTNVVFTNGYDKLGTKEYKCLYCDEIASREQEASFSALFNCQGYSVPEDGKGGIAIGFTVNNVAVAEYEEVTGKTLKYGVFAVLKDRLGENDVFAQDGTAADGVINAELTNYKFVAFEIKIIGFTDALKDVKIGMGAYVSVTDGEATEYSYMQGGKPDENEKYCFVSYNDIAGTPSTNEDTAQ